MAKIINLTHYQNLKRKAYLQKNRERLDEFLKQFLSQNLSCSFQQMTHYYISQCQEQGLSDSWDYLDFREHLAEAIASTLEPRLIEAISSLSWYDPQFMNHDYVLDRCLSLLILHDEKALIS